MKITDTRESAISFLRKMGNYRINEPKTTPDPSVPYCWKVEWTERGENLTAIVYLPGHHYFLNGDFEMWE